MHLVQEPSPTRKKVIVKASTDKDLKDSLRKFNEAFGKLAQTFNTSEDRDYYIVSTKFLQEWTDFCQSNEEERMIPHDMNHDLYQNGKLKQGLSEKEHFEILDKDCYQHFNPFQDKTGLNKRKAFYRGHQKIVPIYLPCFKYIYVNMQILKAIDFNRYSMQKFTTKNVFISQEATFEELINSLKNNEKLTQKDQCRIWIPQRQLTLKNFYDLIKSELKPCSLASYKVQGVGRRIDQTQAKISDVMLDDESYFVFQAKRPTEKFVLIKDDEGRCEGCNQFGKLDFPCGCNKVKYCSERCMEKDKHYHMRRCSYAQEMELNKPVDMTKLPNNRHGIVGLSNLGNTCFMNSCLQCLSNTVPLTQYFLKGYFQAQINKVNPLGTKGKLAKNYAKFIKALWCEEDDTFSPYNVKNAVSDINPIFSGFAQHDSQQFFSFLIDGLHEDLNRIQKKPYVEAVEQADKTNEQIARQSWVAYLKRNQSIITDIMSGQYRSIVTCPDCNHTSLTFDPFISVTLPIPESKQKITDFFCIYHNMRKKNQRAWIKYESRNPDEWHTKANEAVQTQKQRFFLYVVSLKQNIYKVGKDSMAEIAHKIQNQSKNLFLIEFSEEQLSIPKEDLMQFTSRISKESYYGSQELFFKLPMLLDRKKLTGKDIYIKFLQFLFGEAYDENKKRKTLWGGKTYEQYEEEMLKQQPMKIYLRYGKKLSRLYTRMEVDFKQEIQVKFQDNLNEFLQKQNISLNDCQLDARFQKGKSEAFSFKRLKDFDTVGKQPRITKFNDVQISLSQCLQNFEAPQVLEAGNQWYCPKCKDHKLAKKQLSIYRSPDILILHIKRFKQKGGIRKQKNDTLVNFPLELDMDPYLIDKKPIKAYHNEIQEGIYLKPKAEGLIQEEKKINNSLSYELYGVSNHFGGMGGGHYTAYAKNQGNWYNFDDSHVRKVSSKDIVTSAAYLLFYQRKK